MEMPIKSRTGSLFVVILGCVLLVFCIPEVHEGVKLGPSAFSNPPTLVLGLLPLVLGAWCLRSLKSLSSVDGRIDRSHFSNLSHAFGFSSGALLLLLPLVALLIGADPGIEWLALLLLSFSALTAVASVVLYVAARRLRSLEAVSVLSRGNWGWAMATLLLTAYCGVAIYNVSWGLQYKRYEETERILIRNGLLLELDRRAVGRYLSPGFSGDLANVMAAGHAAAMPALEPLDGWGSAILYASSADGQHYELVSTGANGSIDVRDGSEPSDFGDELNQDVVFADGEFRRFRWGSWCGSISLQTTSINEMEQWVQQLHRD